MDEQTSRERNNACQRAWYLKNREKILAYKKAYWEKNREKINAYHRLWNLKKKALKSYDEA